MASMKLLLYYGRCRCLSSPPSLLHSSSFPIFHRRLSSDSTPDPIPNPSPSESPKPRPQPVSIQPVSYSVKPKAETPKSENEDPSQLDDYSSLQLPQRQQQQEFISRTRESSSSPSQETREIWSREDVRYMKDTPSISPVSYPTRVAPLPEDRMGTDGEGGESAGAQENVKESKELERESKLIDAENRVMRRLFRVEKEEEKAVVPFPRLIIPVKKEKKPLFDLMNAIKQVKANAKKTFDETVEAHVRLGIEKGRSDLIVRGTMTFPHGSQKVLRVAVFAEGADAEEARAAGADVVGSLELIEEIASAGKFDFDKCFTTPQFYRHVAKIAKILNRHGLMPDSKQGTVVRDVTKAVKEAKKNQIKFRMDKSSIVHVGLGKVSLTEDSLRENIGAFMNALLQAKPAGLKKTSKYAGYVNSFHICSTMGPGFPVTIQSLTKAVDQYNKVHGAT